MVLNIKLSKALPERAIQYAVDKNMMDKPIRRNLFGDKDPIKEMKETALKFGKWNTREERKTFSMIISPNPKDNPTEEQVLEVSESRVSQLHTKAIVKMRKRMGNYLGILTKE